ncbi:hypothetical protein [Vulgatibacter sp.]|uniref:hypothetical protein n=1 Tax=Vulgatibacter sp. TaxID=1971226 RepID=UPI0035694163
MIQPYLDRVIAWATGPERQEEILRAKEEFRQRTGEFHEDDKSFEPRMAAFLEFFLFDRPLEREGVPPVQAFLDAQRSELPAEDLPRLEALASGLHGIFEIRKLGTKHGLRIREVLSGKDYEIYERRELVGLSKGDILDARIVPWDEESWVFTGAFLYHPAEARKQVLKEAKRRAKADASPLEFAWELARLALKLERYRNVAVEHIYKFE